MRQELFVRLLRQCIFCLLYLITIKMHAKLNMKQKIHQPTSSLLVYHRASLDDFHHLNYARSSTSSSSPPSNPTSASSSTPPRPPSQPHHPANLLAHSHIILPILNINPPKKNIARPILAFSHTLSPHQPPNRLRHIQSTVLFSESGTKHIPPGNIHWLETSHRPS